MNLPHPSFVDLNKFKVNITNEWKNEQRKREIKVIYNTYLKNFICKRSHWQDLYTDNYTVDKHTSENNENIKE